MTPGANDDDRNLQWVHIDDFSPGCYDGSHISTETPTISAPLGAANKVGTYCCAVIPGGALGPLPALTTTYPFSTIGGFPGATTTAIIAGFIITPAEPGGFGEVVTVVEASDGTTHYYATTSFVAPATLHTITGPTYNSALAGMGYFGAPYPAFTRMNATGTGNVPPKLVFPTSDDSGHTSGHLWVYPSIAAPTTYVADDFIGGGVTGQLITYGNRVIVMQGDVYSWPGSNLSMNENFSFTDPPLSNTFGSQDEFFTAEEPWGYGAWGSVSVGELLLVKKIGGALILNGDIDSPTSAISIPGVQSTGTLVGRAKATPIGLIYCSQNQGAWLWNGGNTSQKISRNISDDFFDLEGGVIGSNNYGFYVDQWQKWVLFSGNVIYDTETSSWWNLFPPKSVNLSGLPVGRNIWWYTPTSEANQIAVAPLQVTATTDPWCSIFDNTIPSPVYTWVSLPIHVTPNADRVVDVRQVIIRASDPTNTGTATVSVNIGSFSGTSNAGVEPIGVNPTPIRFNVGTGARGIYDIIPAITASNPTSHGCAPIIHSIDIGYQPDRAGVPVAN